MVDRSVPFYHEIQRMVCEVSADFAAEGTSLYDLGCSTGTTLLALDRVVKPDVRFVGIDNRSEEHTSELQSLMRISYAVFCLKQKKFTSHYQSIMLYTPL